MEQWFIANWDKILLSLVTAGALAFCGFLWKQVKQYKQLLNKEEAQQADAHIEEMLQPIVDDIESIREYVRKVDEKETHKIKLIIQSYRYRLCQLCKLYLRQKYMTFEQFDQIQEFYRLYTGLGGNGEAKEMYEKVIKLEIITEEEAAARKN